MNGTARRPVVVLPMRWLTLLVLLALVAGCGVRTSSAAADDPDAVQIPPIEVPNSRMPSGPIPASLKLPPGKGPFPAVIALHAGAGRGASQLTWARRLNSWGYAVLIPESMRPRGFTRV